MAILRGVEWTSKKTNCKFSKLGQDWTFITQKKYEPHNVEKSGYFPYEKKLPKTTSSSEIL